MLGSRRKQRAQLRTHLFNGFGECCGQEQHLAVGANISQYTHDLGLEAEIKHAVGLVYDDESDAAQIGHATRVGGKHIDHATRSAHDNIGATLEFCNLYLRVSSMQSSMAKEDI